MAPKLPTLETGKSANTRGRADLESKQVCSRCVKSEVSTGLSVLTSRGAAEY